MIPVNESTIEEEIDRDAIAPRMILRNGIWREEIPEKPIYE